jgi:hypothetical protein
MISVITTRYDNSGGLAEFATATGSGATWLSYGISHYGAADAFRVSETTGFSTDWFDMSRHTARSASVGDKTKSPEQVAFEKRKARLVNAVNAMRVSSPNWDGTQTRVNEASAQSAKKFLECLPGNAILPRVAPDGEGDVMFVWDAPGQSNCIVTVEKRLLHLACGLGTAGVKHVNEQRFLGVQVPQSILKHIPTK